MSQVRADFMNGRHYGSIPTEFVSIIEEHSVQLSAIAYVKDMDRAVAFYESLGFQRRGEASPMWTEFAFGDATFALHRGMSDDLPPPSDRLTLNITIGGATLDRLHAACQEHGYPLGGPIQDIGFGRFFTVTDPDGLTVTLIAG